MGITLALSGCCAPLVRSHRLAVDPCCPAAVVLAEDIRPASAHPPLFPDRLRALCAPAMHYLAGPFTPQEVAAPYQPVVQPKARFHPLPARPVFQPFPVTADAPAGGTGIPNRDTHGDTHAPSPMETLPDAFPRLRQPDQSGPSLRWQRGPLTDA